MLTPSPGAHELLAQYKLKPQKSLGQSFLTDPNILLKIVDAAELAAADVVLEVGPGLGHLTRLLAQRAEQVIAVELDSRLVSVLRQELADLPNVTLIQGDILKLAVPALLSPRHAVYQVVANLPYYITSAVLRHFLTAQPPPGRMVLTVQQEVAQRIVAGPGDMSLLAVSVQFYGRPSVVGRIKAGAFYPPPNVDSAIVRIDRHVGSPVQVADEREFFAVVRAGFAQRRKQLRNSLPPGLHRPQAQITAALEAAGVDPRRRPETLSLAEWAAITNRLRMLN
ncbi:MAG: 16S rRNA (adenine(1518)-N(6)/adenine(1519)-N(6))-dimethyltransferase RsmA [Chloroflexota bacterium]